MSAFLREKLSFFRKAQSRQSIPPPEAELRSYHVLDDNIQEEKRIAIKTSDETYQRLLRIRAELISNQPSIRSSWRLLGIKDLLTILIGSEFVTGIYYINQELSAINHTAKLARYEYNNEPQSILGNQTCAESATASIYDLCRGASRTEEFRIACTSTLYDICEEDNGLGLAIFALGALTVATLGYRAYHQYQAFKNSALLRLKSEDVQFLIENKIITAQSRLPVSMIIEDVEKAIIRERFQIKYAANIIAGRRLGHIGREIDKFLDPEDSRSFSTAVGIR